MHWNYNSTNYEHTYCKCTDSDLYEEDEEISAPETSNKENEDF